MPKKKILLLTTGGTIASHKTEYGLAPALTAEEILDFLPSMSSICHLEARNLFSIDSTNMTSAHWMQIAGAIERAFPAMTALSSFMERILWPIQRQPCLT